MFSLILSYFINKSLKATETLSLKKKKKIEHTFLVTLNLLGSEFFSNFFFPSADKSKRPNGILSLSIKPPAKDQIGVGVHPP